MKKILYILIFIFPFLLTSCSSSFGNVFEEFTDYSSNNNDFETIEGEGFYKPDSLKLDYAEILKDWPYNNKQKQFVMPSLGEQRLLVIPVDFSNKVCSSLKFGCETTRAQISNAFFGIDKKNTFYSVASYYNTASFGKLHIRGKVADWYHSNYNVEDIDENRNLVDEIVQNAVNYYKLNNNDIKDFDTNSDGFIDGVALIYATEFEEKNTSFWAYESSVANTPNLENPEPRSYFWASYSFMNANNKLSKVDAHTYIHETGHLLGLSDYYSTDDAQIFRPMGGMDMMDYNIGDHNVFSKMLLNWTCPYVVTDSAEITIKPSYLNGDCILIPTENWNGSAMDEYLLIELYTPQGVNRNDSRLKYSDGENEFSLMKKAGIKMYHVDARVAYFMTYSSSPFIGYLDDEGLEEKLLEFDEIGQKYYRKIAHSNTLSNSKNGIPLIEVIDRRGQEYLKVGALYSDDSLLQKGDKLVSFVFNSGSELLYTVTIQDLNNEQATLQITKNANL